jgi:hypothetical protein
MKRQEPGPQGQGQEERLKLQAESSREQPHPKREAKRIWSNPRPKKQRGSHASKDAG